MTAFRRLNRLPSFKDSFGSLLELDDSELNTVHQAVRLSADDPNAEELVRDDLGPAYSALAVLRQISAKDGPEPLLEDIHAAYSDSGDAIARLAPLLSSSPAERESREIRSVENSTLPVIVDEMISLDYRVVANGDVIKLVPLFVMRLDFDEPISGGSDVVTFQANADAIDRMRRRLDEALTLISKSAKVIGKDALHEQTIAKYRLE